MRFRITVLDELGLIEHERCPLLFVVGREVDTQQRVGGDHNIGVGDDLGQGRTPTRLRRCDGDRSQIREPVAFRRPVVHHARRCDHQKPAGFAVFPGPAEQGECLQCLAQPHVVGQHASQTVVPQERQPVEPVELVVTQSRVEHRRWLDRFRWPCRTELRDTLLPRLQLFIDHAEFEQFLPQCDICGYRRHPAGLGLTEDLRFVHQLAQLHEFG